MKRISKCENFILIKSFASPISNEEGIVNFKRNYVSIDFYQKIEDLKITSDEMNYDTLFIIPLETKLKSEILSDIRKKHNL